MFFARSTGRAAHDSSFACWRRSFQLLVVIALVLRDATGDSELCVEVAETLDLCGAVRKGILATNAGKQSLLGPSSGDVLYMFTVTGDKRPIYFGTCFLETDLDTVLRLYDVCPVQEQLPDYIAANDDSHNGCPYNPYASELTIQLTPGTYYLLVEGSFFCEGNFMLQILDPLCHDDDGEESTDVVAEGRNEAYGVDWNVQFNPNKFVTDAVTSLPIPTAEPPDCSAALVVPFPDACLQQGHIVLPGTTTGKPDSFGNASPDELFLLSLAGTEPRTFLFDTCFHNTNFNTAIRIYKSRCPSRTAVAESGLSLGCLLSGGKAAVEITLEPDTYYVVVEGAADADYGDFLLAINGTECSRSAAEISMTPGDAGAVYGGESLYRSNLQDDEHHSELDDGKQRLASIEERLRMELEEKKSKGKVEPKDLDRNSEEQGEHRLGRNLLSASIARSRRSTAKGRGSDPVLPRK
mmetsp:Transcript_24953/g.43078  ORF Transcript_24953/g.43078 Transcript_24953/m.43078 type:complete len:466 (-) Transcript_24953:579-1976(-)